MKHEMQHPDSPTWCRHCHTFDYNCKPDEECDGKDKNVYYNGPVIEMDLDKGTTTVLDGSAPGPVKVGE